MQGLQTRRAVHRCVGGDRADRAAGMAGSHGLVAAVRCVGGDRAGKAAGRAGGGELVAAVRCGRRQGWCVGRCRADARRLVLPVEGLIVAGASGQGTKVPVIAAARRVGSDRADRLAGKAGSAGSCWSLWRQRKLMSVGGSKGSECCRAKECRWHCIAMGRRCMLMQATLVQLVSQKRTQASCVDVRIMRGCEDHAASCMDVRIMRGCVRGCEGHAARRMCLLMHDILELRVSRKMARASNMKI
eukprot:1160436-Pelagomonas_calceolata.AAC.11